MKFNSEKFEKWEEETHIPQSIFDMVNFIAKKIGCGEIIEETIRIYNRGGYVVGYGKGFSLVHCTSSYAEGPGVDYSDAMMKFLKGLDFSIENSYGDNGMDSSTNWRDTYWTHEFIYNPSIVDDCDFTIWEESDYDDY